jgi:hypothetical protein
MTKKHPPAMLGRVYGFGIVEAKIALSRGRKGEIPLSFESFM